MYPHGLCFAGIANIATAVNKFKDAKYFITWIACDRLNLKHMNEKERAWSHHLAHGIYPSEKVPNK